MVSSVSNQPTPPSPIDDLRALSPDASPQELLQDPRVRAMLDVIAHAEGTGDRYDQTFAYRTIDDLSRHPNIAVTAGGYTSTAAGRYQFLHRTWEGVAERLGLPDFSPQSQDLAAVQLMKDRGMIEPLLDGDFAGAVHAGAPEWASLPTAAGNSYYGQPVRSLDTLTGVYDSALQHHGDGTAPPVQGAPPEAPQTETPPAPDRNAVPAAYTVKNGDTLWDIAREHGIGLQQLLAMPGNANFNANPDLIFRGDVVHLPAGAYAEYRVASGDTLSGIASRHFMDLGDLIGANPQFGSGGSRNPDLIYPGEVLKLFSGAAANQPDATGEPPPATTVTAPPEADPAAPVAQQAPFTVYSGGVAIDGPDQVRSHHSDADGRVYQGQTLIPRDVVLQAPGESQLSTAVPSPVSGTVVEAGTGIAQNQNGYGGRGNYVILRSDSGEFVRIYHFTSVDVRAGDRIQYGEALGTQGNTGRSQGAHVHIESAPGIFDRWIDDLLDGRFDGIRAAA